MGPRRKLKRAAEWLLSRGLAPLLSPWSKGLVTILAYHNIVPDGEDPGGDQSLHVPREVFARQLDWLTETHDIISLADALPVITGKSKGNHDADQLPQRSAVITFDDAYRGAMSVGLEELASRELPATVFVSPGVLGSGGFWWDLVAPSDRYSGSPSSHRPPDRTILLQEEEGRPEAVLARARREGWTLDPPPSHARPVTMDELLACAGRPGLTLGSHGWSHANMSALSPSELEEELIRPKRWLEENFGHAALPAVAYPYGCRSPAVEAAARDAGYRAGFTVAGGGIEPGHENPYRLPRCNIPAGVSMDGFRLRTAGLVT